MNMEAVHSGPCNKKSIVVAVDGLFIANIYCGLAVLILLPVFFTIKDIKLVQRVKIFLFLIFL